MDQSGATRRRAVGRGRRSGALRPRERSLVRLRRAYFAEAAATAARYAIGFDDLVVHLWRVRCRRCLPLDLRSIDHVENLAHAVACGLHRSAAWSDLVDRYEPWLVRRCAIRLGETRSILVVRRTFLTLRVDGDAAGDGGLAAYAGERSLRAWLADRVMSEATRSGEGIAVPHAEVRTKGGVRLRRGRGTAPPEPWWDGALTPRVLRFDGWEAAEHPAAPPPAAGASE